MKIMISSFYEVRHFTPNMIPLSTAQWDQKWYHDSKDKSYFFLDKRNVLNGLRCEVLVFDLNSWAELEFSNEECKKDCRLEPWSCKFMKSYYEQLSRLSFRAFFDYANVISSNIARIFGFKDEPILVLLVHESPKRLCAERPVLQRWFKDNGYELKEFVHESTKL